jgi:hypothetical protein
MSISALKTVLLQNHVNARLLLEKRDLVDRVHALLGDERQERAREAAIHAREEEEIARQHAMMEEQHRLEEQTRQGREQAPPMMGTAADLERNGLCVVCQDEEANIAIVDCGYVFISLVCFWPPDQRFVLAIWRCVATAQILSCPHHESARFAAPVLSLRRASSAYSNHSVVSYYLASYGILLNSFA